MHIAESDKEVVSGTNQVARRDAAAQGARWGLMAGGAALAVLVVAAWYAGRVSGALDEQRLNAELNRVTRQVASMQLRLDRQTARGENLEKALQSSGKSAVVDQAPVLERRLLQLQAQIEQDRAIFAREQESLENNTRLIRALSARGAHLVFMKGADVAAEAVAYVLFTEGSSLLFVGSNLPPPGAGKQFQLWVLRKQEPKVVSAAIFTPDDANRAVVAFSEGSLLSDVTLFAVTAEPEGGSSTPTTAKLLEASAAADE